MTITETIAAIATPPGRGGVGIIRISGPQAKQIGEKIIGRQLTQPRLVYLAKFKTKQQSLIDEGIVLFFAAPNSFTGEDVVELQGHGGPVVLDMLLNEILQYGARLARPGEFSERAFLNNKIDLTQAEAIADLIDANSQLAAKLAVKSLQGELSQRIQQLQAALTEYRMYIEAAIDFPDEDVEFLQDKKVSEKLVALQQQIAEISTSAKQGALLQEGMTVVIAGKPNVGKSSLLNRLAGKDAAIVTHIAGTTRDVLREYIQIDGLPIHIIDTAGLRETEDIVEQEGINRAWTAITTANLILLVVDGTETNQQSIEQQCQALRQKLNTELPILVISNKVDLTQAEPSHEQHQRYELIKLSAKTGQGIELLKSFLKQFVGYNQLETGDFLARRRHLDALRRTTEALHRGSEQLAHNAGELLAEELRQAQHALGEITGEFTADDLLGEIFGRFCIGK